MDKGILSTSSIQYLQVELLYCGSFDQKQAYKKKSDTAT
jgi:hypothetical protein